MNRSSPTLPIICFDSFGGTNAASPGDVIAAAASPVSRACIPKMFAGIQAYEHKSRAKPRTVLYFSNSRAPCSTLYFPALTFRADQAHPLQTRETKRGTLFVSNVRP